MSTMKTDNELIAEFMGMKHQIQVGPFGGEYLYVKNPITKEFEIPKFEISWDWLMPVVEKIETGLSRKYCVHTLIDLYSVTPLYETSVYDVGDALLLELPSEKTRILSVYKAVVEFIKWYNQQSNG